MRQRNGCIKSKKRLEAMTLIEVLLTLVIIATLTTIAYPSYQNQLIKGTRHLMLSDLSRLQLELENRYDNGYVSAKNALLSAGVCLVCQTDSSDYLISVSAGVNSYLISAQPQGKQLQDPCFSSSDQSITLDHSGYGSPIACW
ncbi:type IV pilin protein [Vibrio fluminensis]|uniref:type IV pilin protein n=1 Tax=Vibrio fluminensis TaxID=2783614 RepID=UPI001887A377|nr:type IV pilin protein [Vibrio fluminensis]